MKKVALFVIVAYVVVLTLLLWPVAAATSYETALLAYCPRLSQMVELVTNGWYWLAVVVVIVCEAGLLLIPVKIDSKRPVSRRSVLWPILTSGLLFGLLTYALALAVYEGVGKNLFEFKRLLWGLLGACVLLWTLWSVVFFRLSSGSHPKSIVLTQCRYLLSTGALAVLVAVPCHIIARHRANCCAGIYTFIGISFGLAVMLLSFGPGVYFLYAERWKRLHPDRNVQLCDDPTLDQSQS